MDAISLPMHAKPPVALGHASTTAMGFVLTTQGFMHTVRFRQAVIRRLLCHFVHHHPHPHRHRLLRIRLRETSQLPLHSTVGFRPPHFYLELTTW